MRLIDADALIDEINERIESAIKWGVNAIADRDEEIKLRAEQAVATFCEASLTAKKMPTVDPFKHGHWIRGDEGYHCSACNYLASGNTLECFDGTYRYCPHCGAKMDDVPLDLEVYINERSEV